MGHPRVPVYGLGTHQHPSAHPSLLLDSNSLEWRAAAHSLSAVYADLRAGYPDVPAQMTIPSPA